MTEPTTHTPLTDDELENIAGVEARSLAWGKAEKGLTWDEVGSTTWEDVNPQLRKRAA